MITWLQLFIEKSFNQNFEIETWQKNLARKIYYFDFFIDEKYATCSRFIDSSTLNIELHLFEFIEAAMHEIELH